MKLKSNKFNKQFNFYKQLTIQLTIKLMENTQIQATADAVINPFEIKKTWKMDNEKDFEEISAYFLTKPEYRIFEFIGTFWIQKLKANGKAEYKSLDETFMYESFTHPMIKNGFDSIEAAKEYFLKFANQTAEIIHDLTKGVDY